jgi:cyclopropane fatty-acyl-phospholipid synthase-like methyltransferase
MEVLMSVEENKALTATGRDERELYTPEYSEATVRLMQRRTLASCAPFFLPYLEHGMSVLDCGCGAGSMTLELAPHVAPGEVVGLDLEPHVLEQARVSAALAMFVSIRGTSMHCHMLTAASTRCSHTP